MARFESGAPFSIQRAEHGAAYLTRGFAESLYRANAKIDCAAACAAVKFHKLIFFQSCLDAFAAGHCVSFGLRSGLTLIGI
jgi:hypothetical protein